MIKLLIAVCFGLLLVAQVDAKEANASWYEKGKITASGKKFDPDSFSVAHKKLPFGTYIKLTNPKTGKTIIAVVNDRGPFIKNRDIDVSRASAIALGFFHSGTAKLLIEILDKKKVKNGYYKIQRRRSIRYGQH